MSYLGKGKKEDLRCLAFELQLIVPDNIKVVQLKELITSSANYDEELTKNMLTSIIEERLQKEELEAKAADRAFEEDKLAKERAYELERLKLQVGAQRITQNPISFSGPVIEETPKYDLKRLLPKYDLKDDDISLFLNMFERQLRFLKVPENNWVPYLVGSLPAEVGKLIVREPEEEYQEYKKVKEILLRRYRLTADKFRQLFSSHRKSANGTWRDFYFELNNYLEGWLSELKVNDFDKLKELILADQIKKRVPPEVREHFIDTWTELNSPIELAEKLDTYDCLKNNQKKIALPIYQKKVYSQQEKSFKSNTFKKSYPSKIEPIKNFNNLEHNTVTCYGCGTKGFIKAKCPQCNPSQKDTSARFEKIQIHNITKTNQTAIVDLRINGIVGTACADSGASHSFAGEKLYQILREEGALFKKRQLTIALADGSQEEKEVRTTCVTVSLEGRSFPLTLYALPEAKGNRTLLGTDFIKMAGMVLNLQDNVWFFKDNPKVRFNFSQKSQNTLSANKEIQIPENPVKLRADEGSHLNEDQHKQINALLTEYEDIFSLGGEPTPYIEHRIDTGNAPPVASSPYRLSPVRREILKKEIDALLESGTIEECESQYAAPVVLIPKPNGEFRLCVDYRKLNSITKADHYPLPRMDDLLHDAKQTKYMSTIDLKSGYYQVQMHPQDKDKTAFVCQFGMYRFTRMPFGLKTAPATFQRLIDIFRNGLKVKTLAYLDDIIVMSSTFEEHLEDLRLVLNRLKKFKLHANRAKCHFVCPKVKYLGHYITSSGIQVDPTKVEAVVKIPAPKNVKQVQSFLQSCSWYRRFIPHFAEISKPLSDLLKKKATWKWEMDEQTAFESLKNCLITTPVLRQVDETKPFILRTDASNYALGAILIQGEGSEEHPVEYASRLLSPAEKNYSTTEKEALAVVWALEKFRGYVEGAEIIVASDHQPLKWLLSLKSPTGRLARWALQIQSYNLKIDYIPGKMNVFADMLSRPTCTHATTSCDICTVTVDVPTRNAKEIREEQLKDKDLLKIINCFESNIKDENYLNWTNRGYLMSLGILYRYAPDSESEEAQLVVPVQERDRVLREYHDTPTGGHYGAEGTYRKIATRYYFPGMRKFISDYVKTCADCNRYKPDNQKPAGLLRTPVYAQRFETLAIDLFGPLPETPDKKRWIFIVEDTSTKWVELFALEKATAKECAETLLEEVFLRYGLPRRLISDNGVQFVSAVMQQVCFILGITQSLTPFYWPQANPVERKNRDLKPRLAILVGNDHTSWSEKLAAIRFALNTTICDTTSHTAAYLQFGRELRTLDDVQHDVKTIIENDNFVAEITPYLRKFANISSEIKELVEQKQDQRKKYADKSRRSVSQYATGDRVWVTLHPVSNKAQQKTAKFAPRRDGPYIIVAQRSPTTYELANPEAPNILIGKYHVSSLRPFSNKQLETKPVLPLRSRGRPRKETMITTQKNPSTSPGYSPRRLRSQGGECNRGK